MRAHLILGSALVALLLAACASNRPVDRPPEEPPGRPIKKVSLADVGLDGAALDKSVEPCTDFYRFACGNWVKNTNIPDEESRWMRSFNVIFDQNLDDLKVILEESRSAADPAMAKLGIFYGACMDEASLEETKLAPIAFLRSIIRRVDVRADKPEGKAGGDAWAQAATPGGDPLPLEAVVGKLHLHGLHPFFRIRSEQDDKDATQIIAVLDDGGLGLPDRDNYLKDDEDNQALRAFYRAHVERMMSLAGYSAEEAKAAAADVLAFETELAKLHKSRVERRDPEGMYNKIDRKGLLERKNGFDWAAYLEAVDGSLAEVDDISVTNVPYIEKLGPLMRGTKRSALLHYLEWQLMHDSSSLLHEAAVDEGFALRQRITGQKKLKPRWKRCVSATDAALGELLAQPFVEKRFSGESKEAVLTMVKAISEAFDERVGELEWMDDATKKAARAKLKKMAYLIGYPDKWKTYDFTVEKKGYAGNMYRAVAFEQRRELGKIGQPVDRGEWFMTPPTVNAYYSPSRNQMVFPAGILQPPFFQPDASIAVNLGGMGMVVGHELTHGFDDQGSQYDAYGNLKSWWTPEVRENFDSRTQCIQEQYDAFEVLPGVKLNGKLTLGENIADAGGVKLAFRAYRALRENAAEHLVADGFTEDQQFFLSVAQIWCANYTDEFTRLRAQTDPHAQPNYRVNGSIQNTSEFAEAFSCAAGTPMVPGNACKVW